MNCASCGAALPEGAMFCGNCGRAVNAVTVPRDRMADPRPGDTTVLSTEERAQFSRSTRSASDVSWSQFFQLDTSQASESEASQSVASEPQTSQARTSEPETSEAATPQVERSQTEPPQTARPAESSPDVRGVPATDDIASVQRHSSVGSITRGAEAGVPTRPVAPVPYVLSFSTGERVVVVGVGLLGRRPFTQPGERFDQLVSIADHERSVSKTHLEFGVESGDLWICDRYSANGTVIIPPAGGPHRCEPGRRYRVPRGARVEIGDHWFDVR